MAVSCLVTAFEMVCQYPSVTGTQLSELKRHKHSTEKLRHTRGDRKDGAALDGLQAHQVCAE